MVEVEFRSISALDFLVGFVLFVGFILFSYIRQQNRVMVDPIYRFYTRGLIFKLLGGLAFAFVYMYYYNGGDTIDYMSGCIAMTNLFFKNPILFFDLIFNKMTFLKYISYFDYDTLWPPTHMTKKPENFNVVRIASFFTIITFKSFLGTTLIMAYICYQGIWRCFKLFSSLFPPLTNLLALAFLFLPSLAFWASGIMKDTISVYCICQVIVSFYDFFFAPKKKVFKIIPLLIFSVLLFNIKPYLLLALFPGLLFWASFARLQRIQSKVLRVLVLPFVLFVTGIILINFYTSSAGGKYGSTKEAIETAAVIRKDLQRAEQYGENFFDIGEVDPSYTGVLSKFPVAVIAGLYRPFLWESRSPVMVFSGLENLYLLLFTIYSLIRLRFFGLFTSTFKDPILTLCFTFSIFVAFIVGFTTANFGALVRYRMPLLPFFLSYFFILTYLSNEGYREKMNFKYRLRFGNRESKPTDVVPVAA
ncbi:MAG: hypothetical protein N2050_05245 [Flavobacteriales bacterium]|nr:hypothetical protein [Flavobacteriales bacterium]MCX7649940.1 hypothetical protein [Flavobacteriales bacterium]MDW8431272.1 hypothetical protein [Flavobacteriales bacterium]